MIQYEAVELIVSACLVGFCCRYDGKSKYDAALAELVQAGRAIPVCPEQLGKLPTPREPAQIQHGDGHDVLEGAARVVDCTGFDVTLQFIKGAEETLRICRMLNVNKAILKSYSPSCGSGVIYDGTFTGNQRAGDGVTAALLRQNGVEIMNEQSPHRYGE